MIRKEGLNVVMDSHLASPELLDGNIQWAVSGEGELAGHLQFFKYKRVGPSDE